MTSLTDFRQIACATRTGAFGVRLFQPNELSDDQSGSDSDRIEIIARTGAANSHARRGLEQGNK
ncbi:MAG: hypothetical protein CMH11_07245 [Maritimibacter sp.]|nr:hypothetical protein [Maritimibacter sp.]